MIAGVAGGLERRGLRAWDIGSLPRVVERGGVRGFPALVDEGDSVAVRLLPSQAEQQRAMWYGTRRLLLLTLPSPLPFLRARLTTATKLALSRALRPRSRATPGGAGSADTEILALSRSPYGSVAALLDDCVDCAVDALLAEHGGPAWDDEGWAKLAGAVGRDLDEAVLGVLHQVERILPAASRVEERLGGLTNPALAPAVEDLRAQLAGLVYRGFVRATGRRRLPDLARYLRAMEYRLDRLPQAPQRDRERLAAIERVQQAYRRLAAIGPAHEAWRVRWMIEELRVSLFAQPLGTPSPVSEQRILRAINGARSAAG